MVRKVKYSYKTDRRVCSDRIDIEIEDGVLKDVEIFGGCPGNTKGVAKLAVGRPAQEVMELLRGMPCGGKGTSCPDQLSKAIEEALQS